MIPIGVFLVALILHLTYGIPQSYAERSNNPCAIGAVELYHPYPGDDTRYIQCSQWGYSHIKSCGYGEVWNNGLKTCIHKDATSLRQRNLNRIYTTGPSGYQAVNSQPDYDTYNYGYYNAYGNNDYRESSAPGEPQYYIDADNNVGIIYGSGYLTSGGSTGAQANIQNDLPSDYSDRSVQSSDSRMYQAYPSTNAQNSLWNTFSSAIQTPMQYVPAQNMLVGQEQSGRTTRHQSGRLYGRSTDTSVNRAATHNNLWNQFSNSLHESTNSNTQKHTGTQNTATSHRQSSAVRSRYAGRSAPRAAARRPHSTMVTDQRQLPEVRTYTGGQTSSSIIQPISGFDVPELCRDADVRYVATQNDHHHFYECIKGSAQIKTCPDGEVWVHPLRRCIDLKNPDNQVASHNPCIGSDLRFHPYPADPTKYVECQSWYRVYVWRCKDGLWTQNKQQCSTSTTHSTINERYTRSYEPPPVSNVNTVTAYVTRYFTHCDNTTFFFAHPNPAKYVQCDQIGRSFVKDCAMNTTWDDSIKSCVHSYTGDVTMNEAMETSRSMERVSRQLPAQESYPDLLSYPCPPNYAWNVPKNRCVKVSPSDYMPACARGYIWDASLEECIMYVDSTVSEQIPDAEYARPNCEPGLFWDQALQMCTGGSGEYETNYGEYLYQIDLSETNYQNFNQEEQQPAMSSTTQSSDPLLDYIPNICNVSSGRYYHPYPVAGYKHLFIQCDQLGVMHTQNCGPHKIWNNEIMTCVQSLTVQPSDGRQYPAVPPDNSYPDYTTSLGDVCSQSDTVYHPYPANNKLFIMCVNGTPEPMSCPAGSIWKDEVSTCAWPEDN